MIALLAALAVSKPSRTLLFVHYMPWFQAPPIHSQWGWHWTMNHNDPNSFRDGRRDIAAHDYPQIGPYDSDDTDVVEYQVELMKLSGFDGAFLDWYGDVPADDYADTNRSALLFAKIAAKAGLKVALVYEDRTVGNLVRKGQVAKGREVAAGNALFKRTEALWFDRANYAKVDGRPLLLNFGPEFYKGDQWDQVFKGLLRRPFYVSLDSRQGPADGCFGWPQPTNKTRNWLAALDYWYSRSADLQFAIPPAFPRFDDYYAQAGVQPSWGSIPDDGGQTLRATLRRAMAAGRPFVQVATWNDWGEGTQIEPSVEFGLRDLKTIQQMRIRLKRPSFSNSASDLGLPFKILMRKRRDVGNSKKLSRDEAASAALLTGNPSRARKLLAQTAKT